ncbi:MAG: hypothetical protein ABIQ75_03800 [Flavobacteriales bacterium]
MRILLPAVVLLSLAFPASIRAQNPAIQQIVDAVNVDSMEWHLDTCECRVPAFSASASDPVLPLVSGFGSTHTCTPP